MYPLPKDILCQIWFRWAQWFWSIFFVFSVFHYIYLVYPWINQCDLYSVPVVEVVSVVPETKILQCSLYFAIIHVFPWNRMNKLKYHSPAIQVLLKVAYWFLRTHALTILIFLVIKKNIPGRGYIFLLEKKAEMSSVYPQYIAIAPPPQVCLNFGIMVLKIRFLCIYLFDCYFPQI